MGSEAVIVIVAVVAVVAILVITWLVVSRRRAAAPTAPVMPPPAAPRVQRPDPTPMTGLEEALNRATDRSGTTMADRLESENETVDGFRVTDDTGPLLRRALDRLEPAAESTPEPAPGSTPEPADGEPPSET